MKTNWAGAKDHRTTGGIVAASAMVALLSIGCGKSADQTSSTAGEGAAALARSEAGSPPPAETPTATVASASMGTTQNGSTVPEAQGQLQSDSLPPDVAASYPDVVIPGTVVEITAEASGDVTSIVLADDLGRKVPFTYDAAAGVWRVQYRVPIRSHAERLGFSVTATNSANRFKRVWLFMNVQGVEVPEAKSDSGT